MSNTSNLLNAILNEDAAEIQRSFTKVISEKALEKIAELKEEIASSMFVTEDTESLEEQEKRGRGRPRKTVSSETGEQMMGSEKNIIMQMRTAQDLKPDSTGHYTVFFPSGKSAKIHKKHLDKLLSMHDRLEKPRDKRLMVAGIGRSEKHLNDMIRKLNEDMDMTSDIFLDLCEELAFDGLE